VRKEKETKNKHGCSEVLGKQSGESVELVLRRKKKGCGGKDSRKRKFLSLESQSERVMDDDSDESGESIEEEVPHTHTHTHTTV